MPRVKGLLTRVLTACVLIPLAVLIVIAGGRLYSAIIAFMLILLIFEWTRIVDGAEFSRGFYTLSATAIATVFFAAGGQYFAALAVALGGGAIATLLERRARSSSWAITGAIYLLVPAIATLFVRNGAAEGMTLTLLLFATVWATDSGAYLFGTFVGGPKLWPSLSPKKTWAGAFGGLFCGTVVCLVGAVLLGLSGSPRGFVTMGIILSLAAIVGDLIESAIKRAYGVKDTGGAFPGHGGVLDRLDGFIIAASVLALWTILRQGQPL